VQNIDDRHRPETARWSEQMFGGMPAGTIGTFRTRNAEAMPVRPDISPRACLMLAGTLPSPPKPSFFAIFPAYSH
jgi:hypothetical protein